MRLTQRMVWLACVWPFLLATSYSQTLKKDYLTYIQQAAELGWQEYPGVIANWRKTVNPVLFGATTLQRNPFIWPISWGFSTSTPMTTPMRTRFGRF